VCDTASSVSSLFIRVMSTVTTPAWPSPRSAVTPPTTLDPPPNGTSARLRRRQVDHRLHLGEVLRVHHRVRHLLAEVPRPQF
jgi:hypothetical protein